VKLLYLLLTVALTFGIMMTTTLLLSLPFIQEMLVRQLIIYGVVLFEFIMGVAVFRELLREDT